MIIYSHHLRLIGVSEAETLSGMSKTGSSFDLIELISHPILYSLINTL